jgi:UDP-glucuronate 4-epimerase
MAVETALSRLDIPVRCALPASMHVLVTGAAGFIGMHVAARLLTGGLRVTGADNLNSYYDPALKQARLGVLAKMPDFAFVRAELADAADVQALFRHGPFDAVVHLAAQAGVRYSLRNPEAYLGSNLAGFLHVLEACRHAGVPHLVYASSSSVYGMNAATPFRTADSVDHPVSLYAATKKANELMAHSYSHLYRLPTTGLRFFTVYGPWGRPDMAYFSFTEAILAGRPIEIFNHGDVYRDFTYIDDVVESIARLIHLPAAPDPAFDPARPDPASSSAPYRVLNIGNSRPVRVTDFVAALERALGHKADVRLLPMQAGDVHTTCADTEPLRQLTGFSPTTDLDTGLQRFVAWYRAWQAAG